MTNLELFCALSHISAENLSDAEALQGDVPFSRPKTRKRFFLIAALIALTLLLVGCAVVYVLRLQDLKVGEYRFYVPAAYDENGEVIPVESREPLTVLSVQGSNMEALAEWVAFTNAYDLDGTIALEADLAAKSGTPWDIPEDHARTYGCYSREMVNKLDEIAEKYHLKLLSSDIPFNEYENSILFRALGVDSLVQDTPHVQVEYGDGYFHLEGTFSLHMRLTGDFGVWQWEDGGIHFHYSRKDYFDPTTSSMQESQSYTQWDYTRQDGRTVLLVLGTGDARIYADLPGAFVSIDITPKILENGKKIPMTREALQQLAELFDLSIQPMPATMKEVEQYQAEALAEYNARREAARRESATQREAMYTAGYEEFVAYLLKSTHRPEMLSYLLYDLNGDGIQELITKGAKILSMKDGTSYRYFETQPSSMMFGGTFALCDGNVFEVYAELSDISPIHQYNFYEAEAEGAAFLIGLCHDTQTGQWYQSLDGGTENIQPISQEYAKSILDAHPQQELCWLPLVKFGQTDGFISASDPYGAYIADILNRYGDAAGYSYALLDVNGDGIAELITTQPGDSYMQIFTIRDGTRTLYASDISYLCQGNILEQCEESEDSGRFYAWYHCGADTPEFIEKIVRDPYTLYWGRVQAGQEGRTVRTEEAQETIHSYPRQTLNMKPFSEYPFG